MRDRSSASAGEESGGAEVVAASRADAYELAATMFIEGRPPAQPRCADAEASAAPAAGMELEWGARPRGTAGRAALDQRAAGVVTRVGGAVVSEGDAIMAEGGAEEEEEEGEEGEEEEGEEEESEEEEGEGRSGWVVLDRAAAAARAAPSTLVDWQPASLSAAVPPPLLGPTAFSRLSQDQWEDGIQWGGESDEEGGGEGGGEAGGGHALARVGSRPFGRQMAVNARMAATGGWLSGVVWDEDQPPWGRGRPPAAPLVVDLNDENVLLTTDLAEAGGRGEGAADPASRGKALGEALVGGFNLSQDDKYEPRDDSRLSLKHKLPNPRLRHLPCSYSLQHPPIPLNPEDLRNLRRPAPVTLPADQRFTIKPGKPPPALSSANAAEASVRGDQLCDLLEPRVDKEHADSVRSLSLRCAPLPRRAACTADTWRDRGEGGCMYGGCSPPPPPSPTNARRAALSPGPAGPRPAPLTPAPPR